MNTQRSVIDPVTLRNVKGHWTATDAMGNTVKTTSDNSPKRMAQEIRKKYLVDVEIEG